MSFIKNGDSQELVSANLEIYPLAVFPTPDGQKKRPQGSIRGLRTRSSDYIALRLLLSRLACLRCENRDSYIAFHLPSDGSLAYSAWYMPVTRED